MHAFHVNCYVLLPSGLDTHTRTHTHTHTHTHSHQLPGQKHSQETRHALAKFGMWLVLWISVMSPCSYDVIVHL